MRPKRAIVLAGAGIAGLTASLALARAGFRALVLERSPTLSEAGAGIQLSPNAGHVLAALGLEAALAPIAVEPPALEIRSGRSGTILASAPLAEGMVRRYGAPYRVVHRADLQRILAHSAREAGVEIRLGSEITGFAVHSQGVRVRASTPSSPEEIDAFALIGADGVHSIVRALLPGTAQPSHGGRFAWRAVLPRAAAPEGFAASHIGLWLGERAHLVHYPLRGGSEINLVAIVEDSSPGKGWSEPGEAAWLAERFQDWAPLPQALLGIVPQWLKWPLLTVPPSGTWASGPVALIGDAAHAMSPFLAQGGAMAIEDAAVLAQALSARPNDPEAALAAFAAQRVSRVSRVWRAASRTGEIYHLSGPVRLVRDLGIKLIGGRALISNYDWIHRWRTPDSVPISAAPNQLDRPER